MTVQWKEALTKEKNNLIAKKREMVGVGLVSLMVGLYGHLQVKDELLVNFSYDSLVYYFAMFVAAGGLIYAITTYVDASKKLNTTEKELESMK